MDLHSFELTLEDILYLHRGWIADLYVQHRKTEAEIVDLVHEFGLRVTYGFPFQICSSWTNREQALANSTFYKGV
jgi:hypothetical protein